MKFNLIVLAGATTVLVSACSFTPKEQAEGKFDYTKLQTDTQIQPAPNKQLPALTNRYAIPDAEKEAPIGKNVPILAPTLVWPVAEGSRVEENETQVRVFFDELDGMSDVEQYVWQGVLQALRTRGVSLEQQVEKEFVVTDWLTDSFTYGEEEAEVTVSRKIKIALDTAEHGRTTALTSTVSKREIVSDNDVIISVNYLGFQDREAAAKVLNTVISEIGITQQKGVADIDDDGSVVIDMGFDEDGYASIMIGASFSYTWALMQEVLPELGFEVNDFNQQTGRYYTTYNSEDSGFLFWGNSSEGKLTLPNGDYEVKVTGDRSRTSITLFRDNKAIEADQVLEIFAPFAAEIRTQSGL